MNTVNQDALDRLKSDLQTAIALELSTLPPYLCGLWSLTDPVSHAVELINSIIFDEMAHFGLACNLLASIGGVPEIAKSYSEKVIYPGQLPGNVTTKCLPEYMECVSNFEVRLGFNSLKDFARMCMQIECPDKPVPMPLGNTYQTIAQFYDNIRTQFSQLGSGFVYLPDRQLNLTRHEPRVFVIHNHDDVMRALEQIRRQGEGSPEDPYSTPLDLAHFYAFGELYHGKRYQFDEESGSGFWNGEKIGPFEILPMTPIPKGGYSNIPLEIESAMRSCDEQFSLMLNLLDKAWRNVDSEALRASTQAMGALADAASILLSKRIARTDGITGIYGPQFKYVS